MVRRVSGAPFGRVNTVGRGGCAPLFEDRPLGGPLCRVVERSGFWDGWRSRGSDRALPMGGEVAGAVGIMGWLFWGLTDKEKVKVQG
jgi:hypothetical protein